MKKDIAPRIFLMICAAVFFAGLLWFTSAAPALEAESPLRIVLGGFLVFFLPGLLWGEALGLRSTHVLQTLALSFVLSFIIEMLLIPVPFFFAATIRLWVWLLAIATLAGALVFHIRLKKGRGALFTAPLFGMFSSGSGVRQFLMLLVIAFISFGAYRWGEDLFSIGGEKILHLVFVRYYYSMPMTLADLGITRGLPPPNLVNFWEYLLAGWATLVNTDPLPLFYRSRFVIPLLGFSGMYLLVRSIFSDERKSEVVFFGVLVMCLGAFMTLDPSPLNHLKSEQFRFVMSFMGTAHHADSAMEVLLAVCAAFVFLAIREPSARNYLLLAGMSGVSFLWHPREFFQSLIYAGVLGIVLLVMPDENKRAHIRRWAVVMLVFIAVGAAFFALMKAFVAPVSHGYDEMLLKKLALKHAFVKENLSGVRNLFKFPHHLTLTTLETPGAVDAQALMNTLKGSYHFMLWLIATAVSIPFLSLFGDKEDRRITLFCILAWFLLLAWNFGMLIVIFLTFSEVHLTTPRMLYLFSYVIIADLFYVLAGAFCARRYGAAVWLLLALFFGAGVSLWWAGGAPSAENISVVLCLAVLASFIVILSGRGFKERASPQNGIIAALAIALFFTPILWKEYREMIKEVFTGTRASADWFGPDNPLGLSEKLISALKALPAGSTVLVDPAGTSCVSIYAPQYMSTVPRVIPTVIAARKDYLEVINGQNPVYSPSHAAQISLMPDNKADDFQTSFEGWKGPDDIDMRELNEAARPMMLQAVGGEFDFKRTDSGQGAALKVYPTRAWDKGSVAFANFAYTIGQNGFGLKAEKGQYAVFELTARAKNHQNMLTNIFIAEKEGNSDRKTAVVDSSNWKRYRVLKRIKDEKAVSFGVSFFPSSMEDWLEIKDLKITVTDSFPQGKGPAKAFDHDAVKSWLKARNSRYLLLEEEYYNSLFDYFSGHPQDYRVVFQNPERGELLVEFIGLEK